ncbi:MAG: hypothetical protein HOP12_03890 [Candidatus Eisenbacteria bacterium]|uniref:Na+-transporting NADH:ubiquinone oxidoreductase, subunit NqrB n=1 Tax=Eiseniibacteriota bacterium TaxID=2212470 RepID=A0A849SI91_UNCEI|nr:hypothetical protein [Candidatus Eisenbacteria bacterium]
MRAALLLVVERLRSGGRAFAADARHGQIAVLASLLVFGRFALDFDISLAQIAFTLGGALAFQWAATRLWRLPSFEPRSALISGLSLCLLLRTDAPWLALAAAAIAVFSKFLIRVRGKHLFNPTNLALVAMVLVTGGSWARPGAVWISPGQWGSTTVFAAVLGCAGITVAHRAARSDVAFAFLAGWLCVLFGRAAWLGQPWSVPVHQLESGALVLFTFFMISDPRTTPDARPMRIAFGLAAALLAGVIQFVLFRASGPVWALALLSPAVPLLDRLVPATRFEWTASFARTRSSHLGPLHETPAPAGSTAHDRALALARTHGRP